MGSYPVQPWAWNIYAVIVTFQNASTSFVPKWIVRSRRHCDLFTYNILPSEWLYYLLNSIFKLK